MVWSARFSFELYSIEYIVSQLPDVQVCEKQLKRIEVKRNLVVGCLIRIMNLGWHNLTPV
jgi:hypothetical protein